jgi:hypothetical protein
VAEFLFCGGSSVRGLWDLAAGGFAGRFKSMAETPDPDGSILHHVEIHARHGRTLPTIVDNFPELADRMGVGRRIGVFMVGASDSKITSGDTEPVVPIEDFRKYLSVLGDLCISHVVTPVFIGFHPIDDRHTQPFLDTMEFFSDERVRQYTGQVREHAEETNVTFVPTWDRLGGGTDGFRKFVSADKLHLNSAGHIELLSIVMPTLLEIVAINGQ